MLNLVCGILILLLIALLFLAVPLLKKKMNMTASLMIMLAFIVMSLSIYGLSGDKVALHAWLTGGAEHYALEEQLMQLGGINGMIKKIEQRLQANPDDKEGWEILGKLYKAMHRDKDAENALKKI